MKKLFRFLPLLALSLPALACGGMDDFFHGARHIHASDTIVGETREVSGFTAVEMHTVGRLVLTQGETESLGVEGPDNVVPLIETRVRDGVLVIDMEENLGFTGMDSHNTPTFTIGVKDLSALSISGLGDVEMDGLTTSKLDIDMSGAGRIDLRGLAVEDLTLTISGAGDVELSGEASSAVFVLSGAGNVDAGHLQVGIAQITLSGAGNATLWVTGKLTGTISGAGNVEYYGEPEIETSISGFGRFKSLGSK